jgi:cytochrome c oxidase subunit 2
VVVKVTGQQWLWTFEHEDGTKEVGELHLKKNIPYKFEITSKDVNHAFNIPDLTVMMDAVPGRINTMWVMPDSTGEYLIQCREYCGFSHYQMRAKLFVEDETTPVAVDQAAEKLVPASLTVDSKNSAPVS